MKLTGIWEENREYFSDLLPDVTDDNAIVIGAIEDDTAVAAAVFSETNSLIYVDYIMVAPQYRRKGIGSALIKEFLSELKEMGADCVNAVIPGELEDVLGMFGSLGFGITEGGRSYITKAENFYSSERVKNLMEKKFSCGIQNIRDLTASDRRKLSEYMDESGTDPIILKDPALEPSLCFASIDDKTLEPHACILCERNEDGITVDYLGSFMNDIEDCLAVLAALFNAAKQAGAENGNVRFVVTEDSKLQFIRKLATDDNAINEECVLYNAFLCI